MHEWWVDGDGKNDGDEGDSGDDGENDDGEMMMVIVGW